MLFVHVGLLPAYHTMGSPLLWGTTSVEIDMLTSYLELWLKYHQFALQITFLKSKLVFDILNNSACKK